MFVPEEGAPRWLPPTPSSYCSGLLERGRIRHALTIALLNAKHGAGRPSGTEGEGGGGGRDEAKLKEV